MSADWSVLDDEGIAKVADGAVRSVARNYHELSTEADIRQEALIHLATRHEYVRKVMGDPKYEPKQRAWYLGRWLYGRLTDGLRPEVRYQNEIEEHVEVL